MAAWPQLWRGRIAEAQSSVEAANALREQLGGYPFIGNDAAVQSVVLATASGDTAGANQAVDRLLERIDRAARGKWSFYLHAAGRGLALLGRQAEADVVRQRLVALGDTTPLTRYLLAHLTSLLALGSGRLSDDRELVELGLRLEDDLPIAWVGGSVRLLVAAALVAKNEADQALTTMAPLLDRWESLGLPGCSLLDGPVALPALRLAAEHGSVTAQAALRPFLPGPGVGVEPVGVAPAGLVQDTLAGRLSAREIEVLRLICLGHTNREIAHTLYVSEETVKSHVVHILRKLDVSSRTQAALRARELGYGAD
jgi:DNA-binding CsgD family transcriptional regulator